jgi:hypothetical protein
MGVTSAPLPWAPKVMAITGPVFLLSAVAPSPTSFRLWLISPPRALRVGRALVNQRCRTLPCLYNLYCSQLVTVRTRSKKPARLKLPCRFDNWLHCPTATTSRERVGGAILRCSMNADSGEQRIASKSTGRSNRPRLSRRTGMVTVGIERTCDSNPRSIS